jgi:hypothetical protein
MPQEEALNIIKPFHRIGEKRRSPPGELHVRLRNYTYAYGSHFHRFVYAYFSHFDPCICLFNCRLDLARHQFEY